MENNRISSVVIIIVMIVFFSVITNPSVEMQRQIIYAEQISLMEEHLYKNSNFTESNNFQKNMNLAVGSVFMNAYISNQLKEEIIFVNYLAFSVVKYKKDNKNQLIGISAFGKIFFMSKKFDEIMKDKVEGSMNSFDLYKNEIGL